MSFYKEFRRYNWEEVRRSIYRKTPAEVERALGKDWPDLEDFKALLSPAADAFLEPMAQQSAALTRRRFGRTMQLYLPLYLSNFCENRCVYCGFSGSNPIRRKVLNEEEILAEVRTIKQEPFRHLLLVTGEAPQKAGTAYLEQVLRLLQPAFSQLSLEVQPLDTDDYTRLAEARLHAVYVYQETYKEAAYPQYHPFGRKANFRYRLETPDRLGAAGIRKVGLGTLIGLEDWRTEAWFTALHLQYLRRRYWQSRYSLSFPRLRPFAGEGFQPRVLTNERDLTQLICAYRLFDADVELSLSTRERPAYRDGVVPLGITALSAGSKTGPGAYSGNHELEQFAVNDARSPREVAEMLRRQGFEPVWKDWEPCLQQATTL
ncbi:MAG TPA: 2-iminoacetate synthase ThiH [Bacteroidales bacterium]|nr:2-iminoacetate synthase ThiH [Bacteroidales bacterium]